VLERAAIARLCNVTKTYACGRTTIRALAEVSLDVRPRESLGLFGPSGSGKSTLLNLLAGVESPDGGSIHVAGQDLRRRSADELAVFRRRTVGVVYQSFNLIPSLTVEENVALPLLLDGWSLRRARPRVVETLAAVGLADRTRHRPGELSGGEMQRAAVARALVNDPLLVLADEPTGNLDSRQGEVVWRLLRESASRRVRAVIVATHDPRAERWCDRMIELRDGRVVPGAARRVLRRPVSPAGEVEACATD
jgi:putative ABC transport system ATP-binding protein